MTKDRVETTRNSVAIYEGIRIIYTYHRWVGLSYLNGLIPGDYTRVTSKLLSCISLWNLAVAVMIGTLIFLQMDDVWTGFIAKSDDRFTRLIVFIMMFTTAICVLTNAVTSLTKSHLVPDFIREISQTELALAIPKQDKYAIQGFALWTVVLSAIFGIGSGTCTFLVEFFKCGINWGVAARGSLVVVIRVSAMAYVQPLLVCCQAWKIYLKHICKNIDAICELDCEQELCSASNRLSEIHRNFTRLCKLMSRIEGLLSPILLINYSGSFFICCCCVYFFARNSITDILYAETWINFLCGMFLMLLPALVVGWMVKEAGNIPVSLRNLYVSQHRHCIQREVEMFSILMGNGGVGITASGFFSLNLGLAVTIIGTLITYGMLLIQSKDVFESQRQVVNNTISN